MMNFIIQLTVLNISNVDIHGSTAPLPIIKLIYIYIYIYIILKKGSRMTWVRLVMRMKKEKPENDSKYESKSWCEVADG